MLPLQEPIRELDRKVTVVAPRTTLRTEYTDRMLLLTPPKQRPEKTTALLRRPRCGCPVLDQGHLAGRRRTSVDPAIGGREDVLQILPSGGICAGREHVGRPPNGRSEHRIARTVLGHTRTGGRRGRDSTLVGPGRPGASGQSRTRSRIRRSPSKSGLIRDTRPMSRNSGGPLDVIASGQRAHGHVYRLGGQSTTDRGRSCHLYHSYPGRPPNASTRSRAQPPRTRRRVGPDRPTHSRLELAVPDAGRRRR